MPTPTAVETVVATLINERIHQGQKTKQRLRMRLQALQGIYPYEPSRGAGLRNGKQCLRWLFYQRALERHRQQTRDTRTIIALIKRRLIEETPNQRRRSK